jgi:hypothetical protein
MAALRPAIEHALLQNRRPSHVAAVLYLEGLKLSMATLYDLGVTMWRRGLGQRDVILAEDAAEVGTAQMITIACVVIAARAKSRDGTDALIRHRFVLGNATMLPSKHRKSALRRLTADTRAMLYGDREAVPYRRFGEDKRRHFAARSIAKRAGRTLL